MKWSAKIFGSRTPALPVRSREELAELQEALRTRRRSLIMLTPPGVKRDPHVARQEEVVDALLREAAKLREEFPLGRTS